MKSLDYLFQIKVHHQTENRPGLYTHFLKAHLIFSELYTQIQNHTNKLHKSPAKLNFPLKITFSLFKTDFFHQNNTRSFHLNISYRASTKHCCDTFKTPPSKHCLCFGLRPCYTFKYLKLCKKNLSYFSFLKV